VSDIDLDTWSRGAKNEALRKRSPEEEPRCARALAIVATVAISPSPRERRREGDRCPSLPPRYVPASGSDRAATDPARCRRERDGKKGRERRGEGEEEIRVEREGQE